MEDLLDLHENGIKTWILFHDYLDSFVLFGLLWRRDETTAAAVLEVVMEMDKAPGQVQFQVDPPKVELGEVHFLVMLFINFRLATLLELILHCFLDGQI